MGGGDPGAYQSVELSSLSKSSPLMTFDWKVEFKDTSFCTEKNGTLHISTSQLQLQYIKKLSRLWLKYESLIAIFNTPVVTMKCYWT